MAEEEECGTMNQKRRRSQEARERERRRVYLKLGVRMEVGWSLCLEKLSDLEVHGGSTETGDGFLKNMEEKQKKKRGRERGEGCVV